MEDLSKLQKTTAYRREFMCMGLNDFGYRFRQVPWAVPVKIYLVKTGSAGGSDFRWRYNAIIKTKMTKTWRVISKR